MIYNFITLLFAITVQAQHRECEQYDPALGERGERSHLVSVQTDISGDLQSRCVGTLISPGFVITAAQCTLDIGRKEIPLSVRLGEDLDPTATPIDVQIKKIYIHPEYKRPKKYNDVALLEFEPVSLTRYIQPACLSNYTENTPAFTWVSPKPITVKNMEKVDLTVFDNKECDSLSEGFKNRNWHGMEDGLMCATEIEGKPDMCSYSGSPIQLKSDDQKRHIVGMLSFGPRCGSSKPSVYVRVSEYRDWIKSVVWQEK